jgi:hypothetical protein
MKGVYPSLIGLENKVRKITIPDMGPGAIIEIDVELSEIYLIMGIPEVAIDNALLKARIINGGKNKFTVEIINTDGATTVSNAQLNVDVIGINGS